MLVVAFAISMRVESTAARTRCDQFKAREIAMAAVDEAVAKLRFATPRITYTSAGAVTNYITFPGLISCQQGATTSNVLMYSYVEGGESVDLNFGSRGLINHVSNRRMPVHWIYKTILNSANTPLPTGVRSNVVGRYAYWVDDEATKININTAHTRVTPKYTTEDVDLRTLLGNAAATKADASRTYGQSKGYYSPISWPLAGGPTTTDRSTHFFNITTSSIDTKLTPWGTAPVNLNTLFTTPTPTLATKRSRMQTLVTVLTNENWKLFFKTTDFPGGCTFSNKYGNCHQIAANIIDYITADNVPTDSGNNPPLYLGLKRTPYLNELAVSNTFLVATNKIGGIIRTVVQLKNTTYVELWYMYPNTPVAGAINLASGYKVTLQNRPNITFSAPGAPIPAKSFANATITATSVNTIPSVMTPKPWPGAFSVLTQVETIYAQTVSVNIALAPITVTINKGVCTAVLRDDKNNRLDYALIPMTNHTLTLTKSMAGNGNGVFGTPTNVMWVTECREPRVKPVSNCWNPVGGGTTYGKGTPNAFNSGSVFYQQIRTNTNTGARVLIPSDSLLPGGLSGDMSCHTNIANTGTIASIGELGYIHTGVPWRTLCMGPASPLEANTLPDWALTEAFCTSNTVAGRININNKVHVCTDDTAAAALIQQRRTVLQALYYSTFNATIANNIQTRTWNTLNAYQPPASWDPLFTTNGCLLAGQVFEMKGIADAINSKKVTREAPVRAIANNMTTRSNAFSIWVIAQSIVDADTDGVFDPSTDLIAGEVIANAVVERYEVSGTPKYRIRYLRFYTN
jgi:hypothetical protein